MVKADEVGLLVGADESKSMAVVVIEVGVEGLLVLLGFLISRVFLCLGGVVCLWVK